MKRPGPNGGWTSLFNGTRKARVCDTRAGSADPKNDVKPDDKWQVKPDDKWQPPGWSG